MKLAKNLQNLGTETAFAVLAEVFKVMIACFGLNFLKNFSTLFTVSLSNKVIIQLLIVSYFKHLIIHLCENCIGVIK